MSVREILVYAAGTITITIAVLHIVLPVVQGLYGELKALSARARRTIHDRSFFLVLMILIFAYLTYAHNSDLLTDRTGRTILLFLGIYWLVRAGWRFFGYEKKGSTAVMSILYLAAGACFLLPLVL